MSRVTDLFMEVETELINATLTYRPFGSVHEGMAVLQEEMNELWQAVGRKTGGDMLHQPKDWSVIRSEAIQVAAMAMRLVMDGDRLLHPAGEKFQYGE